MKFAFLQDAQQFRLGIGMQIADFIEEQGAAVGQLKLAATLYGRAGEGAFFVPEQFALDQLAGNGRAVHFDEGPLGEGARLVNVGGEKLLAGAGLADQQDAGIGARRHAGLFHGTQKCRARADHFRARSRHFAKAFILALEGALFQRVFYGHQNAVSPQRLFEEVESTGAGGGHRIGNGGLAGNHDYRRGNFARVEFTQQVNAVGVGKADIHQKQVDAGEIGKGAEFGAGPRRVVLLALALEDHTQRTADVLFVVQNQNAPGHGSEVFQPGGKQDAKAGAAEFTGNGQDVTA